MTAVVRDLDNIRPLTEETERVLRTEIFEGHQIEGGCSTFQKLAKRTVHLKDLQSEYNTIRYGTSVRTKKEIAAIAMCIGAALLVVVAVSVFFLVPVMPSELFAHSLLGVFMSCGLFLWACANAHQVFQHLTTKQIRNKLNEILTEKISDEHATQMRNIEAQLTLKITSIETAIAIPSPVGNVGKKSALEAQSEALQSALNDVQRLRTSLSP